MIPMSLKPDNVNLPLKEAFPSGHAASVIEKMASIIGRRTGRSTIASPVPIEYQNSYGAFTGYLVSVGSEMLRVNFKLGKGDEIVSVDVYNHIADHPQYTVSLDGYNIIQVLDTIIDVLEGKEVKSEARAAVAGELVAKWVNSDKRTNMELVQHTRISTLYKDFAAWCEDQGMRPLSQSPFTKELKAWLTDNNLSNDFVRDGSVLKGSSEKLLDTDKSTSASFQKDILSADEKFQMVERYTQMIVDGHINALIVYGPPGSGKSHTITSMLDSLKAKYYLFKGSIKGTYELAKTLYKYRDDEILVFDDFDAVFKRKDSVNLLKAALEDTAVRQITYIDTKKVGKREKVPENFKFTSGVIVITNELRIDPAIKSRSVSIQINLSPKDMINRIESNLKNYMPELPMNLKMEVLTWMQKNSKEFRRIDFRQYKFVVSARIANPKDWQKWAVVMARG